MYASSRTDIHAKTSIRQLRGYLPPMCVTGFHRTPTLCKLHTVVLLPFIALGYTVVSFENIILLIIYTVVSFVKSKIPAQCGPQIYR